MRHRIFSRTVSLVLACALLFAALPAAKAFAPPTATSFSTAVAVNSQTVIQLQGADTDGTPLTFATTSTPVNAALSNLNTATGVVVFTPTAGWTGITSFTYTVTSGGETSAAATATVTAAKTRVIDTLLNPDGTARKGKVTFILTQAASTPAGITPANATVSAQLSSSGQFDVSVYPSRTLSPQQYYQVHFEDATSLNRQLLGVYDIPASTTTISLAPYRVTDANLAARYTFASDAAMRALTQAVAAATSTQLFGSPPLLGANNLSELASAPTARTNLGLGGMATQSPSAVAVTGGTISGVALNNPAISGTVSAGSINASGTVTAQSFVGNGAGLTNVGVGTSTGHSAPGSVTIQADSDNNGTGIIDEMIGTRLARRVNQDGTTDLVGGIAGYTRATLPTPGSPGRRVRITDECNREVIDTGREWTPVTGEINVQMCGASGAKLATPIDSTTTTTTGTNSAGAVTVTVTSGSTFDNGEVVKITGAGPSGAVYRGVITGGGGTATLGVYPPLHTTVSAGATVAHGDNNVTTLVTAPASAGATSVTVSDPATFRTGNGISIGAGGAPSGGSFLSHIATITNVVSNIISFTPGLTSGVAANALVMHDETAAIQTAIDLSATLRGADVVFPYGREHGVYMVNRANRTSSGGEVGTLLLPEAICCTDVTVGLTLRGQSPRPSTLNPSFVPHQTTTGGAIIQTDNARGAIIAGSTNYAGYKFTHVELQVRDLVLRTYDNPQKAALDLSYVMTATVDSVVVDTGTKTSAMTQPTNPAAIGIIGGGPSNSGFFARNSYTVGYYTGWKPGEHADLDGLLAQFCRVGYEFAAADYPVRLGTIVSNQSATPVKITGAVNLGRNGHLKAERNFGGSNAPAWTAHTYDVDDASNLARGELSVFSWTPPSTVSSPTRNGAKGLLMRHTAFPEAPFVSVRNSTNISIPNATDTLLTFNTDETDTDDQHSTVTNTGRLNCAGLGVVRLEGNVSFAANATGTRSLFITKVNPGDPNSPYYIQSVNAPSAGSSVATNVEIGVVTTCNAPNQYFELWTHQTSGAPLNVISTTGPSVVYSPKFTMTYK